MIRAIDFLVVSLLCTLLAACGGGGGGGSTGDSDSGGGDTTGGGTAAVPLELQLAEGAFWEFFWTTESQTVSQTGTISDSDVGRYRVTLGPSTLIEGMEAFPLVITGNPGDAAPRWTHFAVGDDGSLLGSTDGAGLEIIYNADTGEWVGGGTFVDFSTNIVPVAVSEGTFPGDYNTPSAIIAASEFEDATCEQILGETICDDDSTDFSEREYYKRGVGPIGYTLDILTTDDGGGFFTSTTIEESIELIETSLVTVDGTVFNLPPWEDVASLNQARSGHSAAVLDGLIYVFGGITPGGATNSVEVYDPVTDSWSSGESMPDNSLGPAVAVNGKIYMPVDSDRVRIFDPSLVEGNRWSTVTAVNSGLNDKSLHDAAGYEEATFGDILVGTHGVILFNGPLFFRAYDPVDNQWLFPETGDTQSLRELLRFTVEVVGDSMYVIGGFGQMNSFDDRGARDNVMEFDLLTEEWGGFGSGRLNLARDDHASAVFEDRIYIFGGAPVSCGLSGCTRGLPFREAEVFDPATNESTNLPEMFQPREDFDAVTLDGNIYVIGGLDGNNDELAAVERFTPN